MKKTILMTFVVIIAVILGCTTPQDNPVKIDDPPIDDSDIKTDSYVACGCGCCTGIEPLEEKCLYRSKGDDINTIIELDQKATQNPNCAVEGCSRGIRFRYCD